MKTLQVTYNDGAMDTFGVGDDYEPDPPGEWLHWGGAGAEGAIALRNVRWMSVYDPSEPIEADTARTHWEPSAA